MILESNENQNSLNKIEQNKSSKNKASNILISNSHQNSNLSELSEDLSGVIQKKKPVILQPNEEINHMQKYWLRNNFDKLKEFVKNKLKESTKIENNNKIKEFGVKLRDQWIKDNFKNLREWILKNCINNHFNDDIKQIKVKTIKEFSSQESPVLVLMPTGRIEQLNPAMMTLCKQFEDEIQGFNFTMLLPAEISEVHLQILIDQFKEDKNYEIENPVSRQSQFINKFSKRVPIRYHVEFRKQQAGGEIIRMAIVYVIPQDSDYQEGGCVINPNNPYYLLQTILMLVLILAISVTTPYNLVYPTGRSMAIQELIADFIFLTDCFLNFNVGYYDENVNQVITDRKKITKNYMKGMFSLDLISSIPFSLFEDFFAYGWVLKVFKVVRFVRLIKVTKLVRSMEIVRNFFRSESGRQQYELIYQNIGSFKLLEIIFTLFFMAHYYGCIQVALEVFWGIQDPSRLTKITQHNHTLEQWQFNEPFQMQTVVMIEFIQLGLGYSSIKQYNELEFQLLTIWMMIGFLFFSFSIGNASYYILMENEENRLQNGMIKRANDIYQEQDLSDNLYDTIKESITMNRKKFSKPDVRQLKPIIEADVQNLLLLDCFDEFFTEHKFFSSIPLDMLTILDRKINYHEVTDNLFRSNTEADELFFLIDGHVSYYNNRRDVVNEFDVHSIIGFDEFRAFQIFHNPHMAVKVQRMVKSLKSESKNNLQMEILAGMEDESMDKSADRSGLFSNNSKISKQASKASRRNSIKNIFKKPTFVDVKSSSESDGLEDLEEEEEFKVQRMYTAKVEGLARLYSFDFKFLLEVMKEQSELFEHMMLYVMQSQNIITRNDVQDTQKEIYSFDNNDKPGLIVFSTGMIFMKNKNFTMEFPTHDIVGQDVREFIRKSDHSKLGNLNLNNEQVNQLYNDQQWSFIMTNQAQNMIIKKVYHEKMIFSSMTEEELEQKGAQVKASKVEVHLIYFTSIEGPYFNWLKLVSDKEEKSTVNERNKNLSNQEQINIANNVNCYNDLGFLIVNSETIKKHTNLNIAKNLRLFQSKKLEDKTSEDNNNGTHDQSSEENKNGIHKLNINSISELSNMNQKDTKDVTQLNENGIDVLNQDNQPGNQSLNDDEPLNLQNNSNSKNKSLILFNTFNNQDDLDVDDINIEWE